MKVIEEGNFNVVPTMIGLTKDEGILGSAWFLKNPDKFKEFWYVKSSNTYTKQIAVTLILPTASKVNS